jgi:formylglycine-generating enzyme
VRERHPCDTSAVTGVASKGLAALVGLGSLLLLTMVATGAKPPEPPPTSSGGCPRDMVLVDGDECSEVDEPCLEWMTEPPGEEEKMRCVRFGPSRCTGTLTHARFCIDRYEYPNVKGRLPVVMKTWPESAALCAARGRRLCKGGEWTLACEGEERLPYPYGYVRDDTACNIDRPVAGPFPRLVNPRPRGVEISLVDWRVPSGEMDGCTSPYGVHDMTGNVDEWVVNESGHPYASGLKGGYWGPVRDRCRPMTVAHDEQFAFYQIGFRCCEDPPTHPPGH